MKIDPLKALKLAAHAACLAPLAVLFWRALQSQSTNPGALGPDPAHTVALFTGFGALWLLVLSLAVTPARRLVPRLSATIRFRRMLGLWSFAWACAHLLGYLWLRAGWSLGTLAADIAAQPWIVSGIAAWVSLVPLAATSSNAAVQRLGGKRWRMLHRLAYLAAAAGVAHAWCMARPGTAMLPLLTIALLLVLLARFASRRRIPLK